jgi:hypothetical protein
MSIFDHVQITDYNDKLEASGTRFPDATEAERARFIMAREGDLVAAAAMLKEYVEWRELHGLNSPEYQEAKVRSVSDAQDWSESSQMALRCAADKKRLEIKDQDEEASKRRDQVHHKKPPIQQPDTLPQIVFIYKDECGEVRRTRCGKLLLHVLPARVNKKLASSETYALAIALYLDRKLDRSSYDLATLLLDVRGGRGWANPPAIRMMPFIKAVSSLLHQYYPNRLYRCFVYPLPRAALWIWEIAKPFLDRAIVEAVTLVAGSDSHSAPPPNKALNEHVELDLLEEMETNRLSLCEDGSRMVHGHSRRRRQYKQN